MQITAVTIMTKEKNLLYSEGLHTDVADTWKCLHTGRYQRVQTEFENPQSPQQTKTIKECNCKTVALVVQPLTHIFNKCFDSSQRPHDKWNSYLNHWRTFRFVEWQQSSPTML